jgi:NAD(P)-dependent dehydrogenase (short-subunit alcohol dehydrogenase family)
MTGSSSHLSGRRALVTGASRGIGRGIALALSSAGCAVAASARTVSGLEDTVKAAAHRAGRVVAVPADISIRSECTDVVYRSSEVLGGGIDILVHNAGLASSAKLQDVTLDDWDRLMQVNATAGLLLAQAAAPHMIQQRWGRIVMTGSLASRVGMAYGSSYVASKHAILGLTRVLALELIRHGITANTIIPGWTDTEMVRDQAATVAASRAISPDEAMKLFLAKQPLGRLITIDEQGALVAFLCSEQAAAITGQAINIDGGLFQA